MRFLLVTALGAIVAGCATSSAPPTIPQPQAQPQEQQQSQEQRQESVATSQASSSDGKQEQQASTAEPSGSSPPSGSAADPELVERTRADQAALEEAEADYRQRRANGSLDAAEAGDYAAYVAGLQRRVVEDCVELESSGAELPPDLPCETMVAAVPSVPHAVDPRAVSTGAERTAELDAELQASLGEFDEILIREQDTLDGATAGAFGEESDGAGGRQGSGGGGQEGAGAQGQHGQQGQGQDGQAATGSGGSGSQEGRSEQSQQGKGGQGGLGSPGGQGAPSQTGDVSDGSDDDVVARQLREAAENETDPELKKRLWEEYRKYKQGTT